MSRRDTLRGVLGVSTRQDDDTTGGEQVSGYNGWADWETWNCALWISNDEELYRLARKPRFNGYAGLVEELERLGISETPDGASYADADFDEMTDMIDEMGAE